MREKLLNLMKSEGLTSSRLAEILEIQPSGVSHILSGRNKPGFDLLQKILRRFPRINPDWLLLDSDKMYRDDSLVSHNMSISGDEFPRVAETFFGQSPTTLSDVAASNISSPTMNDKIVTAAVEMPISSIASSTKSRSVDVERVVIFYNDHTFESFNPKA